MKRKMWLMISNATNPGVAAVAPTLAWMAEAAGADFEMYLEAERNGRLFSKNGSTILGGRHFQQFNYLNALWDVAYILFGETSVFKSSIKAFGRNVLVESDSPGKIYAAVLKKAGLPVPRRALIIPDGDHSATGQIAPYLYPEIFFKRELGFNLSAVREARMARKCRTLALTAAENAKLQKSLTGLGTTDELGPKTDIWKLISNRARDFEKRSAGAAFGDPPMILSMLAELCRDRRIAVYAPRRPLTAGRVRDNAYAEDVSGAAPVAARIARIARNPVIVGRQTCDGDIFYWARKGLCIQISDPGRPVFPSIKQASQCWHAGGRGIFDDEPDDRTLNRWADEGKVLASLLVHSGEVAHTEAMLNLVELCQFHDLRIGVGVHAARYETCPQLWELLRVPREQGGALGLVEPVLYSGGMGVLAESVCPKSSLTAFCRCAKKIIEKIAGARFSPRGHLCFMDTDMRTFTKVDTGIYDALGKSGLTYTVANACPGRNRVLYFRRGHIVLNQSSRAICCGSPYVRISSSDDIRFKSFSSSPGWWLGVADAPVDAFTPYIWERGSMFMETVKLLKNPHRFVNVTPHVVARYAAILLRRGIVPAV